MDEELKPLPIVDKVIKKYAGRIINFVERPNFSFGKEMQLHVMEVKANSPFKSPIIFEETMNAAVKELNGFLEKNYDASLLGTGMHPLLKLSATGIWPHRHRKIYNELGKIFNLNQHGWLNIQSFHLNLSYGNEAKGILLHNLLANISPYIAAVSAASPIYEGSFGDYANNRLAFYKVNQSEVPSVTGAVVPEYVSSFDMYQEKIIGKYSKDLAEAGAPAFLLYKEWLNSRGIIFRFDRSALEVRLMDEQECIRSDVALSCFVRAALRGLASEKLEQLPNEMLASDFNSIISDGLEAEVQNPHGLTARQVCKHLYGKAWANATQEEKKYLPLVQRRIENGSLSDIIRKNVRRRARRTDLKEAIVDIYSMLIRCLATNEPYF